jgi:hypothetical protein
VLAAQAGAPTPSRAPGPRGRAIHRGLSPAPGNAPGDEPHEHAGQSHARRPERRVPPATDPGRAGRQAQARAGTASPGLRAGIRSQRSR